MNRKRGVVVFAIVFALIAAAIVLLATGGEEQQGPSDLVVSDPVGDLELSNNPAADEVVLADIRKAEARIEGDEVIFEARLGASVPEQLEAGVLQLKWEIDPGSDDEWTLTGTIDDSTEAGLIGMSATYGSSTSDDTFPGVVGTAGNSFTVLLKANKVSGFPRDFDWRLTATLTRGPASASDTAPDNGLTKSVE